MSTGSAAPTTPSSPVAPTFSAIEIAPGGPLRIAVPVDVNTRRVRIDISSVDQPGVGSAGLAETSGGGIVDVPLEDTNLAAGVYLAHPVSLQGDTVPRGADYITRDLERPYVLSILTGAESSSRCMTEIAAPTFIVVSESSGVR